MSVISKGLGKKCYIISRVSLVSLVYGNGQGQLEAPQWVHHSWDLPLQPP